MLRRRILNKPAEGSIDGKYQLIAPYSGNLRLSADYGNTWNAIANTNGLWGGCAVSKSGQYMCACGKAGKGVWVSSNYGQTWSYKWGSTLELSAIAISENGQHITVVEEVGDWYRSTNGGDSFGPIWWGEYTGSNYEIYMSDNGQHQVIAGGADGGTPFWFSNNYGQTWQSKLSNNNWYGAAITPSGQYIYACNDYQLLFKSSDYGATFQAIQNMPPGRLACSYNGQIVLLKPNGGTLYISVDGGSNFTTKSVSGYLVACSYTALIQTVCNSNNNMISYDSGATFSEKDVTTLIRSAVAMNKYNG